MTQTIDCQRHGSRLTIAFNRPELHNAFNAELIAELIAELENAGRDSDLRVVVLTGNGKSFSAGADLNWMKGMAAFSEAENREDSLQRDRLTPPHDGTNKPTVARVNGAAFGGGVGLIACCDVAIGVQGALFGLTEVRLGLVPAVISPYVIAAIGSRQARRLFLTGERFDAANAQRIGLLHQLASLDQLDSCVDSVVNDLLAAGPVAVSEAKHLIHRMDGGSSNADSIDQENAALIARLRVSGEGQEGLGAFFERRSAAWTQQ